MKKGLLGIMFFCCTFFSAEAQFEEGLLLTFGIGSGYSSHAGSYTVTELFRVKKFSGFRAIVIEGRAGWNFWDLTTVYGIFRVSPANSIVTPYRSTYAGIGLSQTIPQARTWYLTGNFGKYNSGLGRGRKTGSGNLINIGIGHQLGDNLYVELNTTVGSLDSPDPEIDISSEEKSFFVVFSFKF